ncbi:hypothetical protein F4777DRAFT_515726 [Nemania sp. FL0916]|nr:hypothetical protein F4777DRAFT_515726 [Nemania sp. FL0916]
MGSLSSTMGLLSLPPEIRDQVYELLLHPNNNRTYHADGYTDYNFREALALFRVCRTVYYEARDVFRRLNVFARVETPWMDADRHVNMMGRVPILMRGVRATRFEGHTLQVDIATPSSAVGAGGTHHFVLLADDLPAFVRAWFYWNLSNPGLNGFLSLNLLLRDPHAPDWDEPHVRRDVQRRLLLPFGEVKGISSFNIGGEPKPQPKIVAELRALMAVPPPTPEQCLAECVRLKNEGNELLQKGDCQGALATYTRAWEAIHIVVKGRQRDIYAEAFFAHELVEGPFAGRSGQLERMNLRFQLVANTCLAYLKLEDWHELRFWGMRTIELMRQATGANEREVAPEEEALPAFPGAPQVGKIYFRTARALVELGEHDAARRLLRVAQVYLPNDLTVKKSLASLAIKIA